MMFLQPPQRLMMGLRPFQRLGAYLCAAVQARSRTAPPRCSGIPRARLLRCVASPTRSPSPRRSPTQCPRPNTGVVCAVWTVLWELVYTQIPQRRACCGHGRQPSQCPPAITSWCSRARRTS